MMKTVAVIGAGSSGLSAIKCCLDKGLEPTCFEKSDDIGGLWRYKDNAEDDRASIYQSLIINTSKEMMCFSDYPIPDNFPNFMHHSKVMEYLWMFANQFNLIKYIRFKTSVCSIKKSPNFPITGQWIVTTEFEGEQSTRLFDAVMICTGHHTSPNLPLYSFPGIETFNGQYLHSRDYKTPNGFQGKRILVIGIGNSGGDIAVELSRIADQVFLSTRRGAWIVNRVSDGGYPVDIVKLSRFTNIMQTILPSFLINHIAETTLNKRFNHTNYGIAPRHRYLSQHPTINDELPNRIISGNIQVRSSVKEFSASDVFFDDGTMEKDIHAVIFATGYQFRFPFCDESVLKIKNNEISLYKHIFPPYLEKHTMAVIGLVQPIGAIMPISELQSRMATQVFKGLVTLPKTESMLLDVAQKKHYMAKRYVPSQRHTIQVDFVEYMDEIATLAGVKPNLLKLFLTDPVLAFEVFFGPCTPYQYRLMGPGKWSGARHTILTQWNRIIKPTKTRVLEIPNESIYLTVLLVLYIVTVLFFAIAIFIHL